MHRLRPFVVLSFPSVIVAHRPFSSYMASFGSARLVERDGSSGLITIHADDGKHSATIVFCHGLGDSGEGFADVAESFSRTMPWCKFILPTASTRPVTLNGGASMNAWYVSASFLMFIGVESWLTNRSCCYLLLFTIATCMCVYYTQVRHCRAD